MSDPPDAARAYVASLTGLRGMAALFVFFFHYGMFNQGIRLDLTVPFVGIALQIPLGMGWVGVDLFFVLSGFLLSLPFARAALEDKPLPPLGRYCQRRLLRVFPAYYAQLALILAIGAWFLTWQPLHGLSLVAHLAMIFNIGWEPVRPMLNVWWTLPVELSFYLLLPFIAPYLRPRKWAVVLLLGLSFSVAYRAWAANHFAWDQGDLVVYAASHLPGSLPEFLLGASAALLVQGFRFRGIRPPPPRILDLIFLACTLLIGWWLWEVVLPNGVIYWKGHWSMVMGPLVLGLLLASVVLCLYWGSPLGRLLFANPVVYFIGVVSYSLYLWHFVVLQQAPVIFGDLYTGLRGFTRFIVTTLLVVLVAAASYFAFERPFFKLRGKRKPNKVEA